MKRAALALAFLIFPSLGSAAPVASPVAVLPFRNLGRLELDWLRVGLAETILSDLARSGRVTTVERSQIDRALAEIKLQGAAAGDEAATRAGKLVGAKTVVVGAVQEAGDSVRISARFVTVETGVVAGAATVTGPLARVFELQDRVVEKLLGLGEGEAPKIVRRTRRAPSAKIVQAFQLYARALDTNSDADRVEYLQRALQVDPGFVYAADDLAKLEQRMKGYAQVAQKKVQAQGDAELARALDGKLPEAQRVEAGIAAMKALADARRFHALLDAATRLAQSKLPGLVEYTTWALFLAHDLLQQRDLALQIGERYLRDFPAGFRFARVEARMHEIAETRRRRAERRAEFQHDLDEKLRGLTARATPGSNVELELAWAPCICAQWNNQIGELMLENCSRFVKAHEHDPRPGASDHVEAGRFFIVQSLAELGRFDEARPIAERLIAESSEWREAARGLMALWPTD